LKNDRFKNDHFLKNELFKKRSFLKTIVSFSIFRRRYHNETIVFLKNENVNIPTPSISWLPSTPAEIGLKQLKRPQERFVKVEQYCPEKISTI